MSWEGAEENYNVFRWYRAGWGRYSQADPFGLRGGLNEYAYVTDNPGKAIDRLGLTKWKCSIAMAIGSSAVGPGGGGFSAVCKSECQNHKSVFVQIASGAVGISVGPSPVSIAGTQELTLTDTGSSPDANNLVGWSIIGTAGVALGPGGGCIQAVFGDAASPLVCGGSVFSGLSVGVDVYGGYTAIVLGPYESCCK